MRDLLEKLLEQTRDTRYSPSVEEEYQEKKRTINAYLSGSLVPEVKATSGKFTVLVFPNRRYLYINQNMPGKPVGAGKWMGFWDPDLQEVLGLSEEEYNQLSQQKQMEADATVQATKYAPEQFWDLFAETYYPEEYDEWWWDQGGAQLSRTEGQGAVEQYWKKRFS